MSGESDKHGKARTSAPEDRERSLSEERLVPVWDAPDEITATAVRDFLVGQSIEAAAVPVQIAWFGTIETARHGFWGHIEVLEHDAERARRLIHDFFAGKPEREGDAWESA